MGEKTRILILGGGFGGVATAQELSRIFRGDSSVEVTLVNRDNHFVFVPMLASAAAGSIETLHAVAPIRRLVPDARFRAEEVVGIDLERKYVTTSSPVTGREQRLPYDHLVIALGNVINLERLPGVAQHGKTIKTLGDALAIRNHVLQMLEAADIETDPVARREMLTFVVAGGGFSGVEMVGELNDLVREATEHYPSITEDQVRVILLHSRDRILPEMGPKTADHALQQLRKRGVEVRLNARLAGATPHEALLEGGKISTRTLIVAVGNAPPPVLNGLDVEKERGKIVVDEFMQLPEHPGVWALGDNAIVPNGASRAAEPSPPTAQYALRQGKRLAKNIAAEIRGGKKEPFAFGGLGLLCLVGHGAGVGELPLRIRTKGLLGWALWRGVYWSKMPSFGRKLQIGVGWLLDVFLKRDIAQINLSRTRSVGRAHYEAGEYIFRQGEPGTHFYMIAEGEVEVVREHSSGEKRTLAKLGKGQYFGETALLTRGRRNASVRCATPVDVVTVGRDDFAALAGAWSQLASTVKETSDERTDAAPLTGFLPLVNLSEVPGMPPATTQGVLAQQVARLRRDSGGEIELDRDLITLGRDPDNHLVVNDPRVSRRHALIQRGEGGYWVDDLESRNGTWVNEERVVERAELKDGDVIRLGQTRLTFEVVTGSVTGMIRQLDPERQRAGAITGMIQGLDASQRRQAAQEKPSREEVEQSPRQEPPQKEGSITGMIRGLEGPEQREMGRVTGAIRSLDSQDAPKRRMAHSGESKRRSAPSNARILLRSGDGTFEIRQDATSLGRSPDSDIPLLDPKASRRHALIRREGDTCWVEDLDSRNGTWLNDDRVVGRIPLKSGDEIRIGDTRFAFGVDSEAANRPPAPREGSITGMIRSLDDPKRDA